MKQYYYIVFLFIGLIGCEQPTAQQANVPQDALPSSTLQNGDIIFQVSQSSQSKAIQLATKSAYSHMGIIYERDGAYFVYEAISTVQFTPLDKWIKRGKDAHYVVKRLKNADNVLDAATVQQMQQIGQQYQGKQYDLHFGWSDDRLYCSELVWKIYKEATDITIGQLALLKEFDLSHPIVQQKLHERYGDNLPLEEKVISPAAMFESKLLITIPHQ